MKFAWSTTMDGERMGQRAQKIGGAGTGGGDQGAGGAGDLAVAGEDLAVTRSTEVEQARAGVRFRVGQRVVMMERFADGRVQASTRSVEAALSEVTRPGYAVMVGPFWFDGLTGGVIGPLDATVEYRAIRRAK